MKRLRDVIWWMFRGRERVDMAWARVETLEKQNSKLAAALLVQQNAVKLLQEQSAEDLRAREDIATQLEQIRDVVGHNAKDQHRPPVKIARNWRDVRSAMGEEAHAF